MVIPDIRMAPNQYWPIHWHDCWIAVIVMDGECLVGDWWMTPGDVLISAAELEYGPVLNGPEGCQLLEPFHRAALAPGGYAPEYHDHPTLNRDPSMSFAFKPRSRLNQRNVGNQTLSMEGVEGLTKGHLKGGQRWNLGEPGDPNRGVLLDTRLQPGENYPPRRHREWRGVLVLDGSLKVGTERLTKDNLLIAEPNVEYGPLEPGPSGAHVLEFVRKAAAVPCVYRDQYRTDPRYAAVLARSPDTAFATGPRS